MATENLNRILHAVSSVRRRLEQSEIERDLIYTIASNSPVIIVNMNTELIEVSTRPIERMFGYIDGELIGVEVHILVPERLREGHRKHFAKFRANPTPRQMGEQSMSLLAMRKDGSEFPVEIGLLPVVRSGQMLAIATIMESNPSRGNPK